MPLTPVQLVGGSYTSRARSLDLSQTVNVYIEPGADKKRGTLIGTPGLAPVADAHRSPGARPLHRLVALGCLPWQAARSTNCSPTRPALPRGTLITTAGIVNFADDGQHVVAVDGQKGYLLTWQRGSTFAVITDPDWKPATHVAYLNGVMVFNELGTRALLLVPDSRPWQSRRPRLCVSRGAA